jgi:cytochrome c553
MRTIAAALSDEEIEAVAGYAASLERPQGAAP